jgi:hypothetical protein
LQTQAPAFGFSRALKRRLGYFTSPKGLIASFRTRAMAEPALQGTDHTKNRSAT